MSLITKSKQPKCVRENEEVVCYKVILVSVEGDTRYYKTPFEKGIIKQVSAYQPSYKLTDNVLANFISYTEPGDAYTPERVHPGSYEVGEGWIHTFDTIRSVRTYFRNIKGWTKTHTSKYKKFETKWGNPYIMRAEVWKCKIPYYAFFYEGQIAYEPGDRHRLRRNATMVQGYASEKIQYMHKMDWDEVFPPLSVYEEAKDWVFSTFDKAKATLNGILSAKAREKKEKNERQYAEVPKNYKPTPIPEKKQTERKTRSFFNELIHMLFYEQK